VRPWLEGSAVAALVRSMAERAAGGRAERAAGGARKAGPA